MAKLNLEHVDYQNGLKIFNKSEYDIKNIGPHLKKIKTQECVAKAQNIRINLSRFLFHKPN